MLETFKIHAMAIEQLQTMIEFMSSVDIMIQPMDLVDCKSFKFKVLT